MDYKDYYGILGVAQDADEATIKQAYRRLARTYHPDVHPDKVVGAERFKEINEAYTVLSDPEKRLTYDRFGAEWERSRRAGMRPDERSSRRAGPAGSGTYPSGGWQRSAPAGYGRRRSYGYSTTVNAEEFARIFESVFGSSGRSGQAGPYSSDFSEFFDALFGAWRSTAGAAWARAATQPQHGRDIEADLVVSLAEAYQGAARVLRLANGRRIEMRVPPGVDTGTRVRLAGQGGPGLGGGPDGDLYLRIQVAPQPGILRAGDDLRTAITIDLTTAVHGGRVHVGTPGPEVLLTIPPGTRDGQVFRLAGQGMPRLNNPAQRGDLYVQVAVPIPQRPSSQEKELLRELRRNAARARWSRGIAVGSPDTRRVEVGLVAMGSIALLLQLAGLNGAIWLLPAAFALALWGLVARSGRLVLVGGATAMLAGLMLISSSEPVLAALSWVWPAALVVAGGVLALGRYLDKRQKRNK